jgi:hypothetical protein
VSSCAFSNCIFLFCDGAKDKAVSCACRRPSSFLFACPKRKEPKRNGTPMARPPGILPSGYAAGSRGFPTAPPCAGGKLAGILAGHPADFPPPTRRAIGAPGRPARSRRAHFKKAGAEAPGAARRSAFVVAVASGAHDARLPLGLLGGGEPWTRRPRSGRGHGWARLFARAGARSKSPATAHGLAAHGRAASGAAGWPSLLATFLLATQEKSSSAAGRQTKPLRNPR